MKPAIVVPAITVYVDEARPLVQALREADFAVAKLDRLIGETREARRGRVIELGRYLIKVRDAMPKRGTATNGWKAFLEAIEVDDSTAHRYMVDAGMVVSQRETQGNAADLTPSDIPPPGDEDAPAPSGDRPDVAAEAPTPDVDRNTWCTPKWIADAIGDWDLDPCSNERSHIRAAREFRLERGEDGLLFAPKTNTNDRVFINPPYARGQVIQWVEAYAHTRFCFLLKFDPSTEWFGELMRHAQVVLFPRGTRIEFEPPPGVPPEKAVGVQFPHALFYARPADASVAIRELCFPPWRM